MKSGRNICEKYKVFFREVALYLSLGVLVYPAEEVADPAVNPREVQLAAACFVVRAPATRYHSQQPRLTSLAGLVNFRSEIQILLTPALLCHKDTAQGTKRPICPKALVRGFGA